MTRPPCWLLGAVLLVGCPTGEEPVRGANRGVEPPQFTVPEPQEPPPVDAPRPEPYRDVDVGALEVTEEAPERDLAAELQKALGQPFDCVRDFTASSPTTIRVNVSATIRPTGLVITPSVYGSGLSNDARKCLERRVETVVLPALEEPVSQTVSTVIEMEYEPPVIVEADPGVPEPRLRNVREPLPKRPEVAPSGKPISGYPTEKWISGGFDGGTPIQEPTSRKIQGPKPRPIDGYDVDENAQDWR